MRYLCVRSVVMRSIEKNDPIDGMVAYRKGHLYAFSEYEHYDEMIGVDDLGRQHRFGKDTFEFYFAQATVEVLWELLGDTPTYEDGIGRSLIDIPYLHFPRGTDREKIWIWFEKEFRVSVASLMDTIR